MTPVVTEASGQLSYNYTVTNDTELSIILFQLTLPIDPISIASPAGWLPNSFMSGAQTVIQWASEDPASDIAPSGSLAGFVVVAPFAPGPVDFEVRNEQFDVTDGVTTGPNGPTPVPEPSTGMMVLALAALPWVRGWTMKRTQS